MRKKISLMLITAMIFSMTSGFVSVGANSAAGSPLINLTPLLGGLVATTGANNFVNWDAQGNVIQTKSSQEAGWGAAKGSLIDGVTGTGFTGNAGDYVWAYLSTAYSTPQIDEWIVLDLQQLYKVDQFSFSTFNIASASCMPKDFTIDVSANNSDWTTVVTNTDYAPASNQLTYNFSFDPTICRYVRLAVTEVGADLGGGGQYLLALTETSVYGVSSKIDLTSTIEPYRLQSTAGGRMMGWDPNGNVIKVSHSYEDQWMGGTGKGFLIDGNSSPAIWNAGIQSSGFFISADNFASTNTTPVVNEWVQVNLQTAYTINSFAFYGLYQVSNDVTGFPVDFTIDVSSTGENGSWQTVVTKTGYQPKVKNSFTFDPVSCQYVRLNVSKIGGVMAGGTGCYDLALTEIEVYEYWDANTETPEIPGDFIAANNSNINYFGRWTTSEAGEKTAYWGSSSLELSFTGTRLQLVFPEDTSTSFLASIDGGSIAAYENLSGKVNMTPTALASGTHTLRIITPVNRGATGERMPPFVLKGIIVDTGCTLVARTNRKKLMEIVGDSISDGWYGVRVPAYAAELLLNMKTVNIAYAGITLSDGIANWTGTSTGMERQYFKLTNALDDTNAPDWNFTDYQPDAIMINLGTNDYDKGVSEADFKVTYKNFLLNIREKNPYATIYAVSPFGGFNNNNFVHFMETPIREAVTELNHSGDSNIFYIDTINWLSADNARTYLQDDLHPNAQGLSFLGEKLATAIRATAGYEESGSVVEVGADGKLNLTGMLGGLSGNPALVGWDTEGKYIKTSKSFDIGWGNGYGKGFLIDGVAGNGAWPVSSGQFIAATLAEDLIHVQNPNATSDINEFIEINLQSAFMLNKFSFTGFYLDAGAKQSGVPSDFSIDVSTDGVSWTTVVTQTNYSPTTGQLWNTFTFTPIKAQYIRLNATKAPVTLGDTGEYGYTIGMTELAVYGEEIPPSAGDTNLNGQIDINDLIMMRNHIIGKKMLTSAQRTIANLDSRDNVIDLYDLLALKDIILNNII